MSTQVSFDTTGRRLTDKSVIKPESEKSGFEKAGTEIITKSGDSSAEISESTTTETKSSLTKSLNRKIDYHIQQENNEVVIKIRDGETGEIIRQIPQEEFVRLMDRISEFNKNILNEVV